MSFVNLALGIAFLLLLAKWAAQVWLEGVNRRHVLAHAGAVPQAFKEIVDEATYVKSVQYTLAKGRLDQIETTYDAVVLLVALFSGLLPWGYRWFTHWWGGSSWAGAAFLFVTMVALSLPGLPLDWYAQFRLGSDSVSPRPLKNFGGWIG